jgi:hypothetical protein
MSRKALLSMVVGALILLNLVTFVEAYPETSRFDGGCCSSQPLAKDFSAYYVGACWLYNDPTQVYSKGNLSDGGPQMAPMPEAYKYAPSFLLLVSPALLLRYQDALTAFDLVQLLLLPAVALFLYELTKERATWVISLIMVLVLLQPSPFPNWGLSASYYWQWAEGQSKVLETFLLLLSFHLGSKGKPVPSGVVFAFSAFDPRFAALSLPLFLMYNAPSLKRAALASALAFALADAPLLYPPLLAGFLGMAFTSGVTTPLYYYAFIPLAAIICLYAVNARVMAGALGLLTRRGARNNSPSVA